MDTRRLYIGQLLENYKRDAFSTNNYTQHHYTVNFRPEGAKQDGYRVFNHNEGIDFAIEYIRELEKKIDELQYVEQIIRLAKAKE